MILPSQKSTTKRDILMFIQCKTERKCFETKLKILNEPVIDPLTYARLWYKFSFQKI